jgi:hypothetical protein
MSTDGFFARLSGLKEGALDERLLMHRLKSTRVAVLVGTAVALGFFIYDAAVHFVIRWDIMIILASIAAAKLGAMLYYRKTN